MSPATEPYLAPLHAVPSTPEKAPTGGVRREQLEALAREHLDELDARLWTALLRPAVWLVPAQEAPHAPVVGHLGGLPELGPGEDWPAVDAGALNYLGEVDLGALAGHGLDAGRDLPDAGRLQLFLYLDGERWESSPEAEDRVDLWLEQGRAVLARGRGGAQSPAPFGVSVLPRVDLAAIQTWMAPDPDAPALRQVFGIPAGAEPGSCAVTSEPFLQAQQRLWTPRHLWLGGWSDNLGVPSPEEEAEWHRTRCEPTIDGALAWQHLLQVEDLEVVGVRWDSGASYWLTRDAGPDDPIGELGLIFQHS